MMNKMRFQVVSNMFNDISFERDGPTNKPTNQPTNQPDPKTNKPKSGVVLFGSAGLFGRWAVGGGWWVGGGWVVGGGCIV